MYRYVANSDSTIAAEIPSLSRTLVPHMNPVKQLAHGTGYIYAC